MFSASQAVCVFLKMLSLCLEPKKVVQNPFWLELVGEKACLCLICWMKVAKNLRFQYDCLSS